MTQDFSSNSPGEEPLRRALDAAPADDLDSRLNLFRYLDRTGRHSEALLLANELTSLRPRNPGFARLQARTLFHLDDLDGCALALGEQYQTLVERVLSSLSSLGRNGVKPGGFAEPDKLQPWMVRLVLQREFTLLGGNETCEFIQQYCDRATDTGDKDWFFHLKNSDTRLEPPGPDHLSLRMHDALLMLQQGHPRVFNPLTGSLSHCALSLLPDLVLLRDHNENVLVSSIPRHFISTTFETAYILPERQLILDTRGSNPASLLAQLATDLARVVNHDQQLGEYAGRHVRSRGITVADRPVEHLGHYLWNSLSSWSTLFQSGLHTRVSQLACWEGADFFGNPLELYPEFKAASCDTIRISSRDEATELIQASGCFWLPLYDRYIRQDLADRIIRRAESVAEPQFKAALSTLCQGPGPVILLTLRMGNRMWLEQGEAYVKIITELAREFPGAVFVLDGMNASHARSSTHKFMDTEGEQGLAEQIISALDSGIAILDTIGMPIAHSILACSRIDAFIAPWGTAMVKYKWITNKPGVAFGNKLPEAQESLGIGIRVFDKFRDDVIPAVDIPQEYIRDGGAGNHADPLRRNFHLSWQPVQQAVATLLHELGFESDKTTL